MDEGSLGESLTVRAAGEYDPEKQLSDEQIIKLKSTLRDGGMGLRANVCAEIVFQLLADDYQLVDEPDERPLPEQQEDINKLILRTGHIAAAWGAALQHHIFLEGADWPTNVSPPATYAVALENVYKRYPKTPEGGST